MELTLPNCLTETPSMGKTSPFFETETILMARTCQIIKEQRKKQIVAKYDALRKELKETIRKPQTSPEDRDAAFLKLRKLPRDASPTRLHNRCVMTGRARGYYRKFGLSRIALRNLGLEGKVPGLRKSSW